MQIYYILNFSVRTLISTCECNGISWDILPRSFSCQKQVSIWSPAECQPILHGISACTLLKWWGSCRKILALYQVNCYAKPPGIWNILLDLYLSCFWQPPTYPNSKASGLSFNQDRTSTRNRLPSPTPQGTIMFQKDGNKLTTYFLMFSPFIFSSAPIHKDMHIYCIRLTLPMASQTYNLILLFVFLWRSV